MTQHKKRARWLNWFAMSAASILLITGLAKIVSGLGSAKILTYHDPLLLMSFRQLLLLAGIVELTISIVCVFEKKPKVSIMLLLWISLVFCSYRVGLYWIGYHRPCPCMGNLTDDLHLSPQIANLIMTGVLAYLLSGSLAASAYLWTKQRFLEREKHCLE
jgi:hypothetical protein